MTLGDDTSKWLLRWHDVSGSGTQDKNECDGCYFNAKKMAPRILNEWIKHGLPGSGVTECGDNCRCILVPVGIADFSQQMLGIEVQPGKLPTLPGAAPAAVVYQALSDLVQEYKALMGGETLPPEFYDLLLGMEPEQRILYLQQLIDAIKAQA